MRILIYHGKYGDEYLLADTPARIRAALRRLFKLLDEQGCYEDQPHVEEARNGDDRAIRFILASRKGCEYEDWDLEEVIDPCK